MPHGIPTDPKVRKRAEARLLKGESAALIAHDLGLSKRTVSSWAERLRTEAAPVPEPVAVTRPAQEAPAVPVLEEEVAPPAPAPQPVAEVLAPVPADAPMDDKEPEALLLRNTGELRSAGGLRRLRALARDTGFGEALIARRAILLGIEAIEHDRGALLRAHRTT